MTVRTSFVIASSLLLLLCNRALGQQRIVKMPPPVNRPAVNNSAPYISLEGRSLLFVSDNTEDNIPSVFYSSTADGANWKEPVLLSKSINSKLNYLRGFSLSADGKQMYLSSTKGGGLGGYDLYMCNLMGAYWSEPVNVGQPVNSKVTRHVPRLVLMGFRCILCAVTKWTHKKRRVARSGPLPDAWLPVHGMHP